MIKPFNDTLLVEITKSQWTTADDKGEHEDPNAGTGIVVKVAGSADIQYFGSFNWAFDDSMFEQKVANELHNRMKKLINKRVYWEKYADKGVIVEDGDKSYALIKFSKIIAVEE